MNLISQSFYARQAWCGLAALLLLTGTPCLGQDVELKVGDTAPDWKLTGSDGKEYSLSSYKNKQAVVVAWYPMALTGG